MRKITAPARLCACGCGIMLQPTTKSAPQKYLNKKHWVNSGARSYVRRTTREAVRKREHTAGTCPCKSCQAQRFADRTELIARVAAEKNVPVSTAPPTPISAASLAAKAAKRRAWHEANSIAIE